MKALLISGAGRVIYRFRRPPRSTRLYRRWETSSRDAMWALSSWMRNGDVLFAAGAGADQVGFGRLDRSRSTAPSRPRRPYGSRCSLARRGEIFLIRAEHIGEDTIRLPGSHTKTNRPRVIPIVPAQRPWLEHFPLTLTVEGMKSAWRVVRVTAGMPHVNFRDLSHFCASILVGLHTLV